MPIQIENDIVVAGGEDISLISFSQLVTRHLKKFRATLDLEQEAITLRQQNLPDDNLKSFIRNVCTWGLYPGIAGRILNQNNISTIKQQFQKALNSLPDVYSSLQSLNYIRQLGSPSFASKHLRFLAPEICPILDSIISSRLDYSFNARGYKQLSDDCAKVGALLSLRQITNPMNRPAGRWFVSEVEMALFAHLTIKCG